MFFKSFSIKKKFLFIFLLIGFVLSYLVYSFHERNIQIQLEKTTDNFVRAYHTIYNHKKQLSQVMFSGLSSIAHINELLYEVANTNEEGKNALREELYKRLKNRYEKLSSLGLRQLHIVLPNNESFLRMHKPTLYGDDLTGVRQTIEYVNRTQTPIDTFEEGIVFYGFRFVYPLFVNQTYVGCMEVSFGASTFTSSLMNEYYVLSNFLNFRT